MATDTVKIPSRSGSMGKISPILDTIPHTYASEEKFLEEKYEMRHKIGEGSFGVVYEVLNRESNERCACKIIHKDKAGGHRFQLIRNEVTFLKKVQHEHIIRLREIFEIQQKIFLVMELCEDGELLKLVREHGKLSENDAKIVMQRLANAIYYLHKLGLVHRDLKLENILLSKNPKDENDRFYIKVTDFGLSVKKAGNTADDMMDDFCGTPMYMAPEILENKTYSEKCDVWAMGVIMSILLMGIPIFQTGSDLKKNHIEEKFSKQQLKTISVEAKNCLDRLLKLNPADRMAVSELIDHPWLKGRLLETDDGKTVLDLMKEYLHTENSEAEVTTNGGGGVLPTAAVAVEEKHRKDATHKGSATKITTVDKNVISSSNPSSKSQIPKASSSHNLQSSAGTTTTTRQTNPPPSNRKTTPPSSGKTSYAKTTPKPTPLTGSATKPVMPIGNKTTNVTR